MKLNNSYKWSLALIYAIAITLTSFLSILTDNSFCPDSSSYIEAEKALWGGYPDVFRTPLYPLFCSFSNIFPGNPTPYYATIWLQQLFFLLSIAAFYQTAKHFIHSKKLIFFCTLFYACHPGIITWNRYLLTESLAISGCVFLIYTIVRLVQKPSYGNGLLVNLMLILLLLLKPGFIYLLPVLLLYWGFRFYKEKSKINVSGLFGIILTILLFLGYCKNYQERYGIFAPSFVSVLNQYCILRGDNLIAVDNDTINSTIFKTDLNTILFSKDTTLDCYDEFSLLTQKHSYSTVSNFVKRNIMEHKMEYLTITGQRFHYVSSFKFFETSSIFNLTFRIIYFFLFFYFAYLLYYSIKKKEIPSLSVLIWMIVASHLITTIVGAQSEWARLSVPCIPLLIIMVGQCVDKVQLKKERNIVLP